MVNIDRQTVRGDLAAFYRSVGGRLVDASPGESFFVARRQGAIVGVIQVTAARDALLLRNVLVAPTERHAGVGTRLLFALVETIGSLPCYTLADPSLEAFYARVGFLPAPTPPADPRLAETLASDRSSNSPDPVLLCRNARRGTAATLVCTEFERQVARAPEHIAVEHRQVATSYACLNQIATAITAQLRAHGVGREHVVAIALERSTAAVAAILAVLKAGAAWLPLDPRQQVARSARMVAETRPTVIVTDRTHRDAVARLGFPTLDAACDTGSTPLPLPHPTTRDAGDLAYVIYTSGSTGDPNGVMVEQHGLANVVHASRPILGIDCASRVLQFSPLTFDASCWEIFLALTSGATLCIPDEDERMPGAGLEEFLAHARVTHAVLPPSVLAAMRPDPLPELQTLVAGGEPCPAALARRWSIGRRFFNAYGPTEASICTTMMACEADADPVPIGHALPGTTLRLLDDAQCDVPAGEVGEICIGGAGVARGYLYRPALSRQRFLDRVHDRGGSGEAERFYRSGDLASRRPDGALMFVGRRDRQVKIRGLRIELEEIEAVLTRHPDVAHAAVLCDLAATTHEARLVAACVPRAGAALDGAKVREFLSTQLPTWMLPNEIVVRAELPRNTHGKLDLHALRAALSGPPLQGGAGGRPQGELEAAVAATLAAELGVGAISRDDSLLRLGGSSITAARVAARLRAVTGFAVDVGTVLGAHSVAALAADLATCPRIYRAPLTSPEQLPLSHAQERFVLLSDFFGASRAYLTPLALRFLGPLDRAALVTSLEWVLDAHAALRARIRRDGDRYVQQVLAHVEVALADVPVDPAMWERVAADLVAAVALDLDRGPTFVAHLLVLGPHEHVLLLVLHHAFCDAWSATELVDALCGAYAAATGLGPRPTAPDRDTYTRWLVADRSETCRADWGASLEFWQRELRDAPRLALPTDRPRTAAAAPQCHTVATSLPRPLANRLRGLAREYTTTLHTVALAAFALLLHRWTDEPDVVFGSPVALRDDPEIQHLVAPALNTIVRRIPVDATGTARDFIARVHRIALDEHAHKDVPFQVVVDALNPPRADSLPPFFDVLFNFTERQFAPRSVGALAVRPIAVSNAAARADLVLTVDDTAPTLEVTVEVRADAYEPATASRLLLLFERMLQRLADAPDEPIGRVPLLEPDEVRALLELGRGPHGDDTSDRSLDAWFASSATRVPEHVALVHGATRVTYRELRARADAIAGALENVGVGAGDLVALLLPREPDLVAAMLAVSRVGASFVIMEPRLPPARLSFLVEDGNPRALVTTSTLASRLPRPSCPVLWLDRELGHAPIASRDPVDLESVAYVIYTSGSTGQPKGARIRHRSASTLIRWALAHYTAEQLRGVLASSSAAFDLSIFEVFVPLAAGGTVVLVDSLIDWICSPGNADVTLINTVPSVLADALRAANLPASVRVANLAGEPLDRGLVDVLYRHPGVEAVFNLYGPSETTTYSTAARVPRDPGAAVTIGRPIVGTRVFVVDRLGMLRPINHPGELWIAGRGVAAGYLRRDQLSAERFVTEEISGNRERVYRTGDLVAMRADGELVFVGRQDHQVKFHGFRIELGEIEGAIARYPGVRDVAVVLARPGGGRPRLAAFFVPADGSECDAERLRAYLECELPWYMVPATLLPRDRLPRTANGKIARRELEAEVPLPLGVADDTSDEPANETERVIASIWCAVLSRSRVPLDRNFFELGGDSLHLAWLFQRLEQWRPGVVRFLDLFRYTTVRSLAAHIASQLNGRTASSQEPPRQETTKRLPRRGDADRRRHAREGAAAAARGAEGDKSAAREPRDE